MQKYLERVSTNWTEYFAEKKRRYSVLPGQQVHPGGLCPLGLRTDINTNGKTVRAEKWQDETTSTQVSRSRS